MHTIYVLDQNACIRWESVIKLIAPQSVDVKMWSMNDTPVTQKRMLLLEIQDGITPAIQQINHECKKLNISIVCVIDEFDSDNLPVINFLQQTHVEGYFSSFYTLDKLRALLF